MACLQATTKLGYKSHLVGQSFFALCLFTPLRIDSVCSCGGDDVTIRSAIVQRKVVVYGSYGSHLIQLSKFNDFIWRPFRIHFTHTHTHTTRLYTL